MPQAAYPVYYTIRHLTQFQYSTAIQENVMEVRTQPCNDQYQHCHTFELNTRPGALVLSYTDHHGNKVHHFDIPRQHTQLVIESKAMVQMHAHKPLPDALPSSAWAQLDQIADEYWLFLQPSQYARPTPLLLAFADEIDGHRDADPLTTLHHLNQQVHEKLSYARETTDVYSPIDEALTQRQGVCQDFTHILIALGRHLGIPCRYVSGYLYWEKDDDLHHSPEASHAWMEAYLPGLEWIGFDPTNKLVTNGRHIRAAIGRDYADVPPTKGVFKGDDQTKTELTVAVYVGLENTPPPNLDALLHASAWTAPPEETAESLWQQMQQQQ